MVVRSSPLIKGYLPVRLYLPESFEGEVNETFFYVKEHHNNSSSGKNATLFVANAPTEPTVQTRLLLKSLFGRFGEVTRVTVIQNPRKSNQEHLPSGSNDHKRVLSWTTAARSPSFLRNIPLQGKFAHVVFSTNKEMKNALRALANIMASPPTESGAYPGLELDKIEIQTLADETDRKLREEMNPKQSDDEDCDNDRSQNSRTGILAIADRYRKSCGSLHRDILLEKCNSVIQEYEDSEERDRIAREAASNVPDEDGFITVSTSSQIGSKRELEETGAGGPNTRRRKGQKRNRKQKESVGATELSDFYRFQAKDNRKKSLHLLRQQFQEDMARVKRMKEERLYRPF